MAIFDLAESLTEQDLSQQNRKARLPVFMYIEAESQASAGQLRIELERFFQSVLERPNLRTCAEVEVVVYGKAGHALVKECGEVTEDAIAAFSHVIPTDGAPVAIAPVLEKACSRIAAQKMRYREKNIDYSRPTLFLFTAGNIADEAWRVLDAVDTVLLSESVDIVPVCPKTNHPILTKIATGGQVVEMPVSEAYERMFTQIQSSMERISQSTAEWLDSFAKDLVNSANYLKK